MDKPGTNQFGPYPSNFSLFLVRGLLAVERRLQIFARRVTSGKATNSGWNWADGFFTPHSMAFLGEESFRRAYFEAVSATGQDYRIPWRVHQAVWCATLAAENATGDFLELGTGRGFIMAAVLNYLKPRQIGDRKVFLCDVFEAPSRSGKGNEKFADYYASDSLAVKRYFGEWANAEVVEGDVLETLKTLKSDQISFVHVDLNDSEVEVAALELIWEKLSDCAVILLDDYANHGLAEEQRKMADFLSKKGLQILTTAAGQGIAVLRKL